MRSRSMAVAIGFSVVSWTGAVVGHVRASQLQSEGKWLMERSNAEAETYDSALQNTATGPALTAYESRKLVLERAQLWKRAEMLFILVAVVTGFSSYLLYLLSRLRQQLSDPDAIEEPDSAHPTHSSL